jgi:hypothetical protein
MMTPTLSPGAAAVIGIVALTMPSPARAACANLQCRCAIEVGATYNPQNNRWRVDEMQGQAWDNCMSRGLARGGAQTPGTRVPVRAKASAKKLQ